MPVPGMHRLHFYGRWIQDKNKGILDGMKMGYSEASAEYETKFKRQADEFLNQIKDYQKEKEEYEKLLNDYEKYIEELERKGYSDLLIDAKNTYMNLKKLSES